MGIKRLQSEEWKASEQRSDHRQRFATRDGTRQRQRLRRGGGERLGGRNEKQTPLNKRGCSTRLHREPEGSSWCAIVCKSWSGGTIEQEREKEALRWPAPDTRHRTRTRTRSNSKRHVAGALNCTTFKYEASHTRH